MLNLICPEYCPVPFCEATCPADAISIAVKEKNVYCDTDKCNRCGICRTACVTWSSDKVLEERRPWMAEDWARPRTG